MNNQELMKRFEEQFGKMKSDLGFKATLEELDKIFFLKDYVLHERYVSDSLSRQVCGRIANLYSNWGGYLHSIIMPNPQNMLNYNESKQFTQEEKQKITKFISLAMEMSSRNSLIGLTKDKKAEAKLIDDSVKLWNSEFKNHITEIMKKVNSAWKGEKQNA